MFFLPLYLYPKWQAERVLRTINDIIRTLLIHSSMPPKYWAEALRTTTYLLNIRPTKSNPHNTPYFLFFAVILITLSYVFLVAFAFQHVCHSPNKLAPRSISYVFLGYFDEPKGFCCLDLLFGRIHISHHVTFVEHIFPFSQRSTPTETDTSSLSSPTRRAILNPLHIAPIPAPPNPNPTPVAAAETAENSTATAYDNTAAAEMAEHPAAEDFSTAHPDPPSPSPETSVIRLKRIYNF
jgi:hypothetical protein